MGFGRVGVFCVIVGVSFSGLTAQQLVWADAPGFTPENPVVRGTRLVYDSTRERVLGLDVPRGDGPLQVAEWDGTHWQYGPQGPGPRSRFDFDVAYDEAHQTLVLFGGSFFRGPQTNETWLYARGQWRQARPRTNLPARSQHRMAYDPIRQRVVMFGGWVGNHRDFGTWEWDGSDWAAVGGASDKPVWSGIGAMTYDANRAAVVFLVQPPGWTSPAALWKWDGTTWRRDYLDCCPYLFSPPLSALASEPRGVLIASTPGSTEIFLGKTQTSFLEGSVALTYSPTAGVILGLGTPPTSTIKVFTGRGLRSVGFSYGLTGDGYSSVGCADTTRASVVRLRWRSDPNLSICTTDTWDGRLWSELGAAGLPPRLAPSLAHDSARGDVVLFGGVGPSRFTNSETWLFDGRVWRRAAPTRVPRDRHNATMAFDPVRQRMLMFGGRSLGVGSETPLNDTWEWDGTNWQSINPPVAPAPRFGAAAAYDPQRRAIVMVGGVSAIFGPRLAETWQWDGRAWTAWPNQPLPHAPWGAGNLVYDPSRRALLLSAPSVRNKRWILMARGTEWVPVVEGSGTLVWDPVVRRVMDIHGVRYLVEPGRTTDLGGACSSPSRHVTLRPRCDLTPVNPALGLDVEGLRGGIQCALLLGPNEANVPFGACVLRVDPATGVWLPARTNRYGFATFALPGAQLAGREFLAQAVALDLQTPGGVEFSNALRLEVGR